MNVLYDLENDPYEMNNLLGKGQHFETHVQQAEKMKRLLVEWLREVDSPHVDQIVRRPVSDRILD